MYVCEGCIDAEGLAEIIRENVTETECDYCGRTDKVEIAADVEDIAEHMRSCLARDYCDPQESLYNDNESASGYAGDTWYTPELLGSELGSGRRKDVRRATNHFFARFARQLARPIESDDKVHVDYVPTQVLTEFLRVVLTLPKDERLRGIAYRSARHPGGVCYVIFANRDDLVRSKEELGGLSGFERRACIDKEKSAWIRLHAVTKHTGTLSFSPTVSGSRVHRRS